MFVLFSAEMHFVTPICWDFSRLFPSHLTQSKDAPLVSVHLLQKFLHFACCSEGPNIPCGNGNVFSPMEFGSFITYAYFLQLKNSSWDGERKFVHITKMAAMLMYSKTFKNLLLQNQKGRKLVCSIRYSSTTKYVRMMTLGWPWLILRQE